MLIQLKNHTTKLNMKLEGQPVPLRRLLRLMFLTCRHSVLICSNFSVDVVQELIKLSLN